jgi:hypothetical protein
VSLSRTRWSRSALSRYKAHNKELELTEVLNRYLPAIGRFLIVVTFLEDALRILTQWNDQLTYLHDYRHSMSLQYPIAHPSNR